jgi:hypothetical protein
MAGNINMSDFDRSLDCKAGDHRPLNRRRELRMFMEKVVLGQFTHGITLVLSGGLNYQHLDEFQLNGREITDRNPCQVSRYQHSG